MADLTITAASVIKGTGAQTATGTAGATITAGQPLYADSADLDFQGIAKLKLADANVSLALATCVGVSLHAALAGQPLTYQFAGILAIGATVALDMPYAVSTTAGLICPVGDLTTGNWLSVIGRATSTTALTLSIQNATAALGADIA